MKTILKVWGTYSEDRESFEYETEVPPGLDPELYWLIAQGLLFRNEWSDDGLQWSVSLNGKELT